MASNLPQPVVSGRSATSSFVGRAVGPHQRVGNQVWRIVGTLAAQVILRPESLLLHFEQKDRNGPQRRMFSAVKCREIVAVGFGIVHELGERPFIPTALREQPVHVCNRREGVSIALSLLYRRAQ